MRVIAGTARGIRLDAPAGRGVRPTSDRVREATFNALGSLGLIEEAAVLDLFAGSGALGIEALSRGARHATLVDRSKNSVDVIGANLARTRLGPAAKVIQGEAMSTLAALGERRFDIAFLDPPYDHEAWRDLLDAVPAGVVVIESDRVIELTGHLELLRERRYGSTVVSIAEFREPPS